MASRSSCSCRSTSQTCLRCKVIPPQVFQIYISAEYLPEKQMWGMRNDNEHKTDQECRTDQSWFRVIYFPQVARDVRYLISDTPHVAFDEDYGFPANDEARLSFSPGSSYVRTEDYRFRRVFGRHSYEYSQGFDRDWLSIVEQYKKFLGRRPYFARIGGYSRVEQIDPRLEFPDEDWILLFSLDTEGDADYIVGWGGGGVGNFYIRPGDLARLDFSKVMYYWDFG